jgi:hypothetical protein
VFERSGPEIAGLALGDGSGVTTESELPVVVSFDPGHAVRWEVSLTVNGVGTGWVLAEAPGNVLAITAQLGDQEGAKEVCVRLRDADYPFEAYTSVSACQTIRLESAALPPRVVRDPADATVLIGRDVFFTVECEGDDPLSFRWHHNGNLLADSERVTGSGTATLQLRGVTTADSGLYTVVVSNQGASVTSIAARLTIEVPLLHPPIRSGGFIELSWPAYEGAVVQVTPNLREPQWRTVRGSVGTQSVRLQLGPNQAFYRLVVP